MRGKPFPKKHGFNRTPFHAVWQAMIQRCLNPNYPQWADYGGRGITVCAAWREFIGFYIDMWPRPPGLTLERIDNDKGYDAINCKWATRRDQILNRRKIRGTTSRFKGVYRGRNGRWYAQLSLDDQRYSLGTYDVEEDAAQAYLRKRAELAGS